MKYMITAGILASGTAHAEGTPVTFENCTLLDAFGADLVECDISNRSETAVSSLSYHVLITEPGRPLPWVNVGKNASRSTTISDALEPGETVSKSLRAAPLNGRANLDKINIKVSLIEAFDANGVRID